MRLHANDRFRAQLLRSTVLKVCSSIGLALQHRVGMQLVVRPVSILLLATLNRKKPLLLISLWTLMPVLLSALIARVLPRVNPTPLAFDVLPFVNETRLDRLVVGTRALVTAMPQPVGKMTDNRLVVPGLVVTAEFIVPTRLTTLPVTAQLGVVPVLNRIAWGMTRLLLSTCRRRIIMRSSPSSRCPHLRSCPITVLNTALMPRTALLCPPSTLVSWIPPLCPTWATVPMKLVLLVNRLSLCSPLRLAI